MISILIPIYNQDITALVASLLRCSTEIKQEIEIRCYDDGSDDAIAHHNVKLHDMKNVVYRVLEQNIGRARIRNLLARDAKYPYVLYLDGDSIITRDDFLSTYVANLADCVNGGRTYRNTQPEAQYNLHWTYGRTRESRSLAMRRANPLLYFHSNNFLIRKELILVHPFPEGIEGYGYEDLAFATALDKAGVTISHIDNTSIHGILDDSTSFIQKTITASQNLKRYYQEKKISRTPLIRAYERLDSFGLTSIYTATFQFTRSWVMRNLTGKHPSMFLLNLLKLYHFILSR